MYVLLKQEVWWVQPLRIYKLSICCSTSEAIACLDFKRSKSKFYGRFSDLLKIAI